MLNQADLHRIQQDLVKQMADGVVVIPAGMEVLQLPCAGNTCEILQDTTELMEEAGMIG